MNSRQFGILLALLVVLGGAGLMIYNKRGNAWAGGSAVAGKKILGDFQVNDVAQISIVHGGERLTLAKKDDTWRVGERGDFPADFDGISKLLIKLRDLKAVQSEKVGASQLSRLELSPQGSGSNTATLVQLHDASGKPLRSLLLGKKLMQKSSRPSQFGGMDDGGFPAGRYLMADAASGDVLLTSDALTEVEPRPAQWIEKSFVKIEKPRTISATHPHTTNSWSVTRESETAEWRLDAARADEKLDQSKAGSLSSALASATISDVVVNATAEQTGLASPTALKLSTFDGFDYVLNIGGKSGDDRFVSITVSAELPKTRTIAAEEKPEDKAKLDKEFADRLKQLEQKLAVEKTFSGRTFLVSDWSLESLLKQRGELLEQKASADEAHDHPSPALPGLLPAGNP